MVMTFITSLLALDDFVGGHRFQSNSQIAQL